MGRCTVTTSGLLINHINHPPPAFPRPNNACRSIIHEYTTTSTRAALPRVGTPTARPIRPAASAVREQATSDANINDAAVLAAYKALQNGSDIRGVAVAGVPDQPVTLHPSTAFFIGKAFAQQLAGRLNMPTTAVRIAVGRDPRISGPMLTASLLAGIASTGAVATPFGLSTTPAMFMCCVLPGWQYDGGIMVTASHLPFNRNGFKFCTDKGGLEKADIADLLSRAAQAAADEGVRAVPEPYADAGRVMAACLHTEPSLIASADFLPAYAAYIREVIISAVAHPKHPSTPLEGWHVVVNAGNGAGGFFADQVLQPLGASTAGSINLEPDGTFPAHIPNPEDKTAMGMTVEAVLRSKADLGIVFDTDVDRSGVVDADGTVINKNRYIALMAAITLREYPGTTVVTCSTTSNGLTGFIEGLGGRHLRFKKGYRNVIGKGMELDAQGIDAQLMMETSGHGAMKENYFLDDGAYAVVKILIECVRRRLEGKGGIGELLAPLPEPAEASEFRLKITAAQGLSAGADVLQRFHDWVESGQAGETWRLEAVNHEGWRVAVDEGNGKSGWLLLRSSLHDPQMVLNVESEVQGGVRTLLVTLEDFLQTLPEGVLDVSPVLKALC